MGVRLHSIPNTLTHHHRTIPCVLEILVCISQTPNIFALDMALKGKGKTTESKGSGADDHKLHGVLIYDTIHLQPNLHL